jgi:hypothetical protein
VSCDGDVERATGIEPAPSVWKTETLPLSYARAPGRPRTAASVLGPRAPRRDGHPREPAVSIMVVPLRLAALYDGMWRSLVAHSLWERGAVGSNPAIPTRVTVGSALAVRFPIHDKSGGYAG